MRRIRRNGGSFSRARVVGFTNSVAGIDYGLVRNVVINKPGDVDDQTPAFQVTRGTLAGTGVDGKHLRLRRNDGRHRRQRRHDLTVDEGTTGRAVNSRSAPAAMGHVVTIGGRRNVVAPIVQPGPWCCRHSTRLKLNLNESAPISDRRQDVIVSMEARSNLTGNAQTSSCNSLLGE